MHLNYLLRRGYCISIRTPISTTGLWKPPFKRLKIMLTLADASDSVNATRELRLSLEFAAVSLLPLQE